MARPREFDRDQVLDAAIGVFREHGFEGTSTDLLVRAMKIGRQSLYDTFGDKWQLYQAALERYATAEVAAHLAQLQTGPRAIDGIRAMIDRVVATARQPCLGVGAICEFGRGQPELTAISDAAGRSLDAAVTARAARAQAEGDMAADLDPADVAGFMQASFAGIRIAARGGAGPDQLRSLGKMALRALQ